MGKTFTTTSDWQRSRATELHDSFVRIERAIVHEGTSLAKAICELSADLANKTILCRDGAVKLFKASETTLKTNYYRWKSNGKKAAALLHDYKPGRAQVPPKLVAELHSRATREGQATFSTAIKSILDDWKAGKELPGLGTWEFWWSNEYPERPMPEIAPEFPYSARSLYRFKPSKRERAYGNKGIAAGRAQGPFVRMNYSKLRKCELFTLDDVRLDIICIDESTGRAVEVVCYLLMEVASRSIVAYILKPRDAIQQRDVDELLAYGLQSWGIGDSYPTHIKFERGTVACSEAAETVLEAATEGGIIVHRTSMDGGVRWTGSPRDKASGHAAGKAVIESFNRKLHLALMHLPGQRGNKFENQPANLGYDGANKISPGSLADESQKLAQFELLANSGKTGEDRIRLKLAMLYLRELDQAVREAVKRHNTEPGHDYQGHGKFIEQEIAPGVWRPAIPIRDSAHLDLTPASVQAEEPVASVSPSVTPTDAGAVSEQGRDRRACEPDVPARSVKTYVLKADPTKPPTAGEYWRLWQQVERIHANNPHFRHQITAKNLGCHPKVKHMTPEQLAKMISVFKAIIRDSK